MLLILILSSGWATSFSNSIMVAGKHYVSFEGEQSGPVVRAKTSNSEVLSSIPTRSDMPFTEVSGAILEETSA